MNSAFHPSIYLGCFAIVLVLFFCALRLEKLTLGALLLILLFAIADCAAHGEDVRDANGKLITRSVKAHGFETVRDAATGRIREVRETRGRVTTVRDASGKILRTERK